MKKSKKFLIATGIALAGITVYSYFKDKLKEIECDAVSEKLKKDCEECEKIDDVTEDTESRDTGDTI